MSNYYLGEINVARAVCFEEGASLVIKGTQDTCKVEIPEDKVEAFLETAEELKHAYIDDPPEDSLIGDGGIHHV